MSHPWLLTIIFCLFVSNSDVLAAENAPSFVHSSPGTVLGESSDFIVLIADESDSYDSLAARYLGDYSAAWYVRSFNTEIVVSVGDTVVVPRTWKNRRGVKPGEVQLIPVLTYHRFREKKDRLSVTPENFRAQLQYLRDHGYHVARFRDLEAFIRGEKALPPRTVVIAIDDGYQSTYKVAYPLLKEFNMPAVVYVYSDFTNYGGLKTRQMQEMMQSGLIEFESHSKTHSNLDLIDVDESRDAYVERIEQEVSAPKHKISDLLGTQSTSFAYPYGAVNLLVLDEVKQQGYENAFTVERGSISGFDYRYLLRRSMVYGEYDLQQFAQQLVTVERFELK